MKVLVTSKSFGKYNPEAIEYIRKHGIEIVKSDVLNSTPKDIARQIKGCVGLIVGNDTVDREVIESADKLKIIHMHGTGVDAIDVNAATRKGIWVANVPGGNSNAVAEMTVALMLSLARKIFKNAELLKKGKWEREAGREISGSTVGLLGFGNIGKRIVELLSGFHIHCIAYDPYVDASVGDQYGIHLCTNIEEVFKNADWLILALPLNSSTEKIVNSNTLSLMKPSAYLINTARGGLVDEKALCMALERKQIAGAALDAFAVEPLPMDSPLRQTHAILTPHIAATTVESAARVSMIVAENIVEAIVHGVCKAAVNQVVPSKK